MFQSQGLIPVASASQLEAEAEKAKKAALNAKQNSLLVQSLASHVKKRWDVVKHNRTNLEERLSSNLMQRNGEYDSRKLSAIREHGGSEIFMMLTSVKCRGASSWLRDTLMGNGADKPWTLDNTPMPDLPPEVVQNIQNQAQMQVAQAILQNGGMEPPVEQIKQMLQGMKDQAMQYLQTESKKRVERMELKMEDQLIEGGFPEALSQFIDDVVTFPTAIMKGPIVRKRKTLEWNGTILEPTEVMRPEWERVDPFKFYPAPWISNVNDGFLIERHQLTRADLESLIGVEGYDEDAIRAVLSEFGEGGLREWLSVDSTQALAEGKDTTHYDEADLIDAIQLWDEVQGKTLLEWGMSAEEVLDKEKCYPCECWLIGNWVIKAVLNYDPLGRKPYFATSYEKIPGAFWGNGVPDLIRDCQDACNATARSLMNNMGLSSGPQVGVNVSRLPVGEKPTEMFPWKLWQFETSDYQDGTPPISFFQPNSNAQELLTVFERFSALADEYSGIPRYMTGENTPGAGRTSSGLSMMINNASKGLKQVINNIDKDTLTPLLVRLYQYNLRYSADPDLIGDVNIVAKGAMSLVAKESAAVRRNEFLQLCLSSPIVQQIVGVQGVAELLRDAAKQLDMPVDKIVPSREALEQQMMAQQQAAMQQQMMAQQQQAEQAQQQGEDRNLKRAGQIQNLQAKQRQLQADGTPKGGREGSLMHNRVTGSNGLGGR